MKIQATYEHIMNGSIGSIYPALAPWKSKAWFRKSSHSKK